MMEEAAGSMELILTDEIDANIEIELSGGTVLIKVNKKRVFETLCGRDNVLGGLNAALTGLLRKHLHEMKEQENAMTNPDVKEAFAR